MTGFVLAAALLVVIVLAVVVRPLWRRSAADEAMAPGEQRELNLAVFRDQLAELERERGEGSLSEADFAQARSELQRRLLDEVALSPEPSTSPAAGRKTAWVVLAVLPLAAAAGYAVLGTPRALDPQQHEARVTPAQIERMLEQLGEKLKTNPDDLKGWAMLARSYKVLERYAESAEAFGRARSLVEQDAGLLAEYAEVLAQLHGGNLAGKPGELIAQALRLNPDHPQALLLAGVAASERGDFSAAATHWARLLAQLEPGSNEARTIEAALDKVRELAAQTNSQKAKAARD